MPEGYEVDLKKNYTIPKKKAKSEKTDETDKKDKKSNSTKSSSKKKDAGVKELNETQI